MTITAQISTKSTIIFGRNWLNIAKSHRNNEFGANLDVSLVNLCYKLATNMFFSVGVYPKFA